MELPLEALNVLSLFDPADPGKRLVRFGELLKEFRLRSNLSLRQFCKQSGFDAGNYSKLERGILPPPAHDDHVRVYAEALGFSPGSDEWIEIFDSAAAERARLPGDLVSEDVVNKLPLLFKAIRLARNGSKA